MASSICFISASASLFTAYAPGESSSLLESITNELYIEAFSKSLNARYESDNSYKAKTCVESNSNTSLYLSIASSNSPASCNSIPSSMSDSTLCTCPNSVTEKMVINRDIKTTNFLINNYFG